jgi:hypothetical protein
MSDAVDAISADGEKIRASDYVAVLLVIEKIPTVVLGELVKLWAPHGANASTSGLTLAELADSKSSACVRPLTAAARDGILFSTGASSHKELRVVGSALLPLTLRAEVDTADGGIKLVASVGGLNDVAAALWLRVADEPGAIDLLTKAPGNVAHRDASGARLFTTEMRTVLMSRANARRSCPFVGCPKELSDEGASLTHAAHHVLYTPATVPFAEMCFLCYGPASECPVFVEKTSSSCQPRIACTSFAPTADRETLDRCIKFTAGALAKSSKKSPSTNRPIVCPACHPDLASDDHKLPGAVASKKRKDKKRPAVWSYNMKAHWRRLHDSTAMPVGLESALKLAPDEKKLLKSL